MACSIYYGLYELGVLLGVYSTEKEAMEAANKECAVINYGRALEELASGYKIEVME